MPNRPKQPDHEVVAAVPIPSGDLIAYRFDQIDDKLEKMDQKLENMQHVFMTREEAAVYRQEITNKLNEHTESIQALTDGQQELRSNDDRQQGAIDAKREMSVGRVAGIAATGAILSGIAEAFLWIMAFKK